MVQTFKKPRFASTLQRMAAMINHADDPREFISAVRVKWLTSFEANIKVEFDDPVPATSSSTKAMKPPPTPSVRFIHADVVSISHTS